MPINDQKPSLFWRALMRWSSLIALLIVLIIFLPLSGNMHGAQQPNRELTGILNLLRSGSGAEALKFEQEMKGQGSWSLEDAKQNTSVNRFTVLLVGVDQRVGEKSIGNTDTLLVVTVNLRTKDIAVLSIPRDTKVEIDGHGVVKINAVARWGHGLEATVRTVEELIGEPIDGYALANFVGFKKIIDVLGGITVTVEKDMYYLTGDAEDGIINLRQGTQRLNGDQALQYVRFRHDQQADLGRTNRQQAVVTAVGQELLQARNVIKLPRLIPELYSAVKTDLSLGQVLTMSRYFLNLDINKIASQTLPGQAVVEDGISYWQLEPDESRKVVQALWADRITESSFSGQRMQIKNEQSRD